MKSSSLFFSHSDIITLSFSPFHFFLNSYFSGLEFSLFRDVSEVAPYYAVVEAKISSLKQQSEEEELGPPIGS